MSEFNTLDVTDIGNLPALIRELRELDIPSCIIGPPGIGKSEGIQAALEEDDIFVDLRLSQLDAVDVRGLPRLSSVYEDAVAKADFLTKKAQLLEELGEQEDAQKYRRAALAALLEAEKVADVAPSITTWSRPSIWPTHGKGIICLEEFNTAAQSVQNALLQTLGSPPGRDRFVGEHRIPSTFYWCLTGNRKEDFAHVIPLSSAVRNRLWILNIGAPNVKSWTKWALNNDVHPYVVSFIRFDNSMLYQPPSRKDEYASFPSPRAWARIVSPLVKRGFSSQDIFVGAVGRAAGVAFHAYLQELKDMPDIDKILSGKETFDKKKYKDRVSIQYAITTSLFGRCSKDLQLITPAMTRIIDHIPPEIGAIFVALLLRADDRRLAAATVANRHVIEWATRHRQLIEAENNDGHV